MNRTNEHYWETLISEISPGAVKVPQDDAAVTSNLEHLGIIEVTGDEAGKFLQGQLTNDIFSLASGESQLSAYCSPKGRILAVFRILRTDESHFLLVLARELIEPVLTRLRMFVLMAKVQLHDLSDRYSITGIMGNNTTIAKAQEKTGTRGHAIRIPAFRPCALILSEEARSPGDYKSTTVFEIEPDTWNALQALSGIPDFRLHHQEKYTPHMLNLPAIGAVSFNKGCYTGQEVVARTQYLGKTKRRIYFGEIEASERPELDREVVDTTTGNTMGTIFSAHQLSENVTIALMILSTEGGDFPDRLELSGSCSTCVHRLEDPWGNDE